jgi:hypothetical protein
MVALAEEIESGSGDLQQQAQAVQKFELEELLTNRGWPARRQALVAKGVDNPDQYRKATPEEIRLILDGESGETKGFTMPNGDQRVLRVRDGKVFDVRTKTWRDPSEMNLAPSINTQRILDAGSAMKKEIAKAGAEHIFEMHEKYKEASKHLRNIDDSEALISGMPTGKGADIELWLKQTADYLGFEQADVTNAEQYLALAGGRVASIIQAFGAGTGLSDADREFSNLMAAGTITKKAESLRNLLKIMRREANITVDNYKEVYGRTRDSLGGDGYIMDSIAPREPKAGFSEKAKSYFGKGE